MIVLYFIERSFLSTKMFFGKAIIFKKSHENLLKANHVYTKDHATKYAFAKKLKKENCTSKISFLHF